ncbi:TPA: hypothetical protein DCW38_03625 [candidate division WOR-3 bacterium]|jgi:hypothetical protein|uniref:DUF3307 domain-containing protein n=1 Tax=candidate division WOR-3 bacterium TaxID=2052148 RepID=A0A350H9N6_UNCW3|nr:hypothetical protein [candidate division WOR-3 bacterium]
MNSFFPDKNLVIILLLGHLIGDFVFQTNKVFKFKLKGIIGILWHSLLVSAVTLIVLSMFCRNFIFIITASIFIFIFHFIIDLAKYKSRVEEAIKFIIDQIAHFLSIIILSIVMRYIFSFVIINASTINYAMFFVGIIMVLYFVKYFIKSLYKILDIKNEISVVYRFMESGERFMIFFFSYMHGFYFLLIALAVIPRSIYAINNNKQHIFYDIIISMLISSGAGIILRKATLDNPFSMPEFLIFSSLFFLSSFIIGKLIDLLTGFVKRRILGS